MSVFYMKHKKHGTKVATEEAEVEHDKKRGWELYEPPAIAAEQKSEPAPAKKAVQAASATI